MLRAYIRAAVQEEGPIYVGHDDFLAQGLSANESTYLIAVAAEETAR